MSDVFITSGMDLQALDTETPSNSPKSHPVPVRVRLDTWHHWLLVACDNTALATTEESVLHGQIQLEPWDEADSFKVLSLEAEFRTAMTAVSACAFAVDAFYATVVQRFGPHPDTKVWRTNRTARHAQMAETFRYRLKPKPKGVPVLRQFLEELFRLRDTAVHPSAAFAAPVLRDDLGTGVEPRFVTYSADHARAVLGKTVDFMTILIGDAEKVAKDDDAKWARFAVGRIDVVHARAMSIPGVVFPSELGR